MPTLGMTELDAVNEILIAIGEQPVSELDPAGVEGVSWQARAQRVLDAACVTIQSRGWPENTYRFDRIAPETETNVARLPPDTLAIEGAGDDEARRLTVRRDRIWDMGRRTDQFPSWTNGYVTIHRVVRLDFEDCSPQTKELIVAHAKTEAQRYYRGNPQQDAWNTEGRAIADHLNPRAPELPRAPMNQRPIYGVTHAQRGGNEQ